MTIVKIGTGGWAYFNVPGDRLWSYSQVFNVVEVNSTFYEYPDLDLVKSWQKRTPKEFEFVVRSHRDLSHKYELQPRKTTYQIFDYMMEICSILRASILSIQTPPSMKLDSKKIDIINQFFSSLNTKKIRISWEIRTKKLAKKKGIKELMCNNNLIHCIDISKGEEPIVKNDLLHTRIFGKGEHNVYQFYDEELRDIENIVNDSKIEKSILNFHNVRQYKDAARLKIFRNTGKFPKVTSYTGIQSLVDVLKEDTRFPISKSNLIMSQGWKIFDWSENKRLQVKNVINVIPDKTYDNLIDLTKTLKNYCFNE